MHWNGLRSTHVGFDICQIQWHLLQVPTISGSWKITISGINFTFCWFWLGTMHWNCLSGAYLRLEALNSLALVASPYDNWFIKNHNFRRHIQQMGFKSMKMGWDICSSPPWVTIYPYTMFQNSISWPSHNKCRKTIIIQKVLVTQSCNIVHCNWHTQKPTCADWQAFVNILSLCKLKFFVSLLSGRVQETAKISHFVDFDWGQCIEIAWVVHI